MLHYQNALTPSELLDVLHGGDSAHFKSLLRSLPEPVVDEAFEHASPDERAQFLRLMPVERAASTFTDRPLAEQARLLPDLPPDRLRLMGAFIGPDEVADLLGELSGDEAARSRLLASLPSTLANSARALEHYPDDDAGGLMTPEFVALREGVTVKGALDFLRRAADQAETVHNLFVVDAGGALTGTLPLERLLTARPEQRIGELARHDVIFARTDTDQEEVARLMRDYDLGVLPVVDASGVLRGIVTVDDVLDVVQEEATEDIYRGAAMEGSEIDYPAASPTLLWRKRIGWLLILFVTESLTANVISHYDRLVAAVPALAIYFPTLIGTGGNTGSQSATLVVRALATGQIRGRDTLRVLVKEFGAGLLIGLSIGVIAFARIALFRRSQGLGLALTAALAMTLIAIFANLTGALLPLLFQRLKVDPALTSSPFLATVMDATGLLIYFNVAIWVLRL